MSGVGSGGRLEVVPEVVARLRHVLVDGAVDLEVTGPTDPTGLGGTAAAHDLARETAIACDVVAARLDAGRAGLRQWGDAVAGFEAGVREVDDRLAGRLAALARRST